MGKITQIQLALDDMPRSWYNIVPDLPKALPPPEVPKETHEGAMEEVMGVQIGTCMEQELSEERYISIPDDVWDLYAKAGRPTALCRAEHLEKFLKTPARMYYKREDQSPTGSFKINTAIPQAYYAAKEGFKGLCSDTGAGQWGTALAYAASITGVGCTIFWVRNTYEWKKDRRSLMELYGAKVFASPSDVTEIGRQLLKENPRHPGSLGITVAEALEYSIEHELALGVGSVLNNVLLHNTMIGLEVMKQFELIDEEPDVMISCVGGGSNFAGFIAPFVRDTLKGKRKCRFLAAQTMASPNLVKGEYRYDYTGYTETPPQLKMYTLGHRVEMPQIYAEGLRYHSSAPILSLLRHEKLIDAVAYPVDEKVVFKAAKIFLETEGFLPAPESAYSIRAAIDEALKYKETEEEKVIAFNISGHGFLDLSSYRDVLRAHPNATAKVQTRELS